MTEDSAKFPPVDPVKAALTASCPRCGNGKLFDGFSKPRARCNSCGLDLSWVDAGDGPAIFVILLADLWNSPISPRCGCTSSFLLRSVWR